MIYDLSTEIQPAKHLSLTTLAETLQVSGSSSCHSHMILQLLGIKKEYDDEMTILVIGHQNRKVKNEVYFRITTSTTNSVWL